MFKLLKLRSSRKTALLYVALARMTGCFDVDKASQKHVKLRRPKTAPAACSASPIFADNVAVRVVSFPCRHSIDVGSSLP